VSEATRGAALWLLPALAVGAFLRLWGLARQIVVGDEIHGLIAAIDLTLPEILTTYRMTDHCIPLSALYRVLLESGVRLTEGIIRAPAVLAGLAALVLFPLGVARWRELDGGRGRAVVLGWLLAVSPSLVYFSRFARPYAEVLLLAPLAVAAFWHWWRGGGHRFAVLYAAAGAASAWFFLGSAPFVAAPLAWAAGELAWRRLRRRPEAAGLGLLALAAAGAALAVGIAAFLLPALPSFFRLVRQKAASARIGTGELGNVLLFQAGTTLPLLALLFWGLAVLGLAALLSRRPALGSLTLVLVVVQWTVLLLVLRPTGIHMAAVANRYVLVTLPIVLLWVAEGLGWLARRLEERGGGGGGAARGAVLACIGGLVVGGPYVRDLAFRIGSFAGTTNRLASSPAPTPLPPAAVPAAYRLIGEEPGDEAVVEAISDHTAIYALGPVMALARVHGRPVILASDRAWRSDPGFAFRTIVPADPRAIERSGGRFVVLQLDAPRIRALERAVAEGGPMPPPSPSDRRAVVRARRFALVLTRAWGEPHLVSGDVLVWDLARLPRSAARD